MKLIWIFESIRAPRTWLRAWCQQPKSWVVGLLGRTAKLCLHSLFSRHQEEKERKTKTPVSIHAPRRWCDRVVCGNGEGGVGTWRKRVAAAMATAATGGHTQMWRETASTALHVGAHASSLCLSKCVVNIERDELGMVVIAHGKHSRGTWLGSRRSLV